MTLGAGRVLRQAAKSQPATRGEVADEGWKAWNASAFYTSRLTGTDYAKLCNSPEVFWSFVEPIVHPLVMRSASQAADVRGTAARCPIGSPVSDCRGPRTRCPLLLPRCEQGWLRACYAPVTTQQCPTPRQRVSTPVRYAIQPQSCARYGALPRSCTKTSG